MRRYAAALVALGLVSLNARDVAAQDPGEAAAANAVWFTPVGSFAPTSYAKGWDAKGKMALAGEIGILSPSVGDGNTAIGVTGAMKAGAKGIFSATAGYTMTGGTDTDDGFMLGGDYSAALWSNTGGLALNFRGAAGFASVGDASFLSLVGGAPITWSKALGASSSYRAVPQAASQGGVFAVSVMPGFAWGRMSADVPSLGSVSENGTVPMIGLGADLRMANGWSFGAGYNHVVIDDAAKVFSFRVGMPFGGAAR
jgi:hypothetical protein